MKLIRRQPALLLLPLLLLFAGLTPPATADGGRQIRLHYATFDPVESLPAIPAPLRADPGNPYALLQLNEGADAASISALEARGVRFHGYVPEQAYLVRVAPEARDGVRAHPAVRWLGDLHPAYLLSPYATAGPLLVERFPDSDPDLLSAAIAATGAVVTTRHDQAALLVVEAPEGTVEAVAGVPGVRWVQSLLPMRELNDDARWVGQGNRQERTPLYARGLTGAGQVGAVADSGLAVYDYRGGADALHNPVPSCFFLDDGNQGLGGSAQLPGPMHRKVIAYEIPTGSGGDRIDSTGHGTHVAGSVAGDGGAWDTLSPADGQAYEARLFFQDIGRGVGFAESPVGEILPPPDYGVLFAEAYDPNGDGQYQPALEPRTHSNSWGSTRQIYSIESAQTDAFMWQHPDFLIFYAAGNQGPAPLSIGYPATAKNIVTVGGTENGYADPDSMGYFSSHGPVPLGRMKPEVVAPGDRVTSAANANPCGTVDKSGTSMATPTVHGLALLMRQYLTEGFYPTGAPTAADAHHPSAALLKALLMSSGRPMGGQFTDDGNGGGWPSNGQGWGRVTADDVLYFPGDARRLWVQDRYALDGSVGFAAPGQSESFTIRVGSGAPFGPEPLRLMLAWSDYPGEPVAGGGLVNDLDLTVTGPDGRVHLGNDAATNDFVGPHGLPPLAPDRINPWEGIFLADPLPGLYTVTVRAHQIGSMALDTSRRQGFALVATGDLLSSAGRLQLEYPEYSVADSHAVSVRLTDLDLNQDAGRVEQATVTMEVGGAPAGTLTLVESGPDSAIFAATADVTAAGGQEIIVRYEDADDGHGRAATAVASAVVSEPPLRFVDAPALDAVTNEEGAAELTLEWSGPAGPAVSAYEIQHTTAYTLHLEDDAEGDLTTHWESGPLTSPWLQSPEQAHEGLQAYWSGRGDLLFGIDNTLTTRSALPIPAGMRSELRFYSRYYNDFNDRGLVEVSADGGAWQTLRALYADPRVVPATAPFRLHQFDLTPFGGSALRLRFRYDNGVFSAPPDSPGWWVDNIVVQSGAWRIVGQAPGDQSSGAVTIPTPGVHQIRLRARYADGSVSPWSRPRPVTVTQPPRPESPEGGGHVSGGGWLDGAGDRIHFNFNVRDGDDGPAGQIKYRDRAGDIAIHVGDIQAIGAPTAGCPAPFSGPEAVEVQGTGELNGAPATFRLCVTDGGAEDRFLLTCLAGCDTRSDDRTTDLIVDGGNIQLHVRPAGAAPPTEPAPAEEPVVLLLEPLLAGSVPAGTSRQVTVQVIGGDGSPLAGVPLALHVALPDGTSQWLSLLSDTTGLAETRIPVGPGETELYVVTETLESNGVTLTGQVP